MFVLLSNANNSFAMHCYGSILFDSSLFIRVFFSSLVRWLLSFNFGFRLLWWRLFNNFVSFTIFVANFFALFPFHFLRAVFTIKGSTLMLRHANRHMNGAFLCIGMIWLNPNIWSIFIFFISRILFPLSSSLSSSCDFEFYSHIYSFQWRASNSQQTDHAFRKL